MRPERQDAIAWDQLMRLGLGALRLPPEVFWSMTPVELHRALEGAGILRTGGGGGWMDRRTLAALMAQYPDRSGGKGG